jgi:aminopeptidase N
MHSTYINALFLEERYGKEAYDRAIRFCRNAWIDTADENTKLAIANMAVYSNTLYRAVVFCKTPVILDALRRKLGDEAFFAGFRSAFAPGDRSVDGFERLESGFEQATDIELRSFFDQWIYRADFPELEFELDGAQLIVRQTQEE